MEIDQGAKRWTKRSCYKGSTHQEGIAQGYYQEYPFVTRDGLEYAKQWKFQVSNSVLQGATVWEVETSSSEEEVQILERPAAKARPTPKASEPFDLTANRLGSKGIIINICCATGKKAWNTSSWELVQSQLRRQSRESWGRPYLPDTVVWDRGNKLAENWLARILWEWTSRFATVHIAATRHTDKADSPEYPKFIRFSWPGTAVESLGRTWLQSKSHTFLNRLKEAAKTFQRRFVRSWLFLDSRTFKQKSEEAFALHSRGLRFLVVRAWKQLAFQS